MVCRHQPSITCTAAWQGHSHCCCHLYRSPCMPLCGETTPQDILDAISAHVLPMQQSLRYLPTLSGNRYCCYVAVGSDPLSWEGTVDCCPYCVAKFALRGLVDCARHDLPHAHVEEIYPGNFCPASGKRVALTAHSSRPRPSRWRKISSMS